MIFTKYYEKDKKDLLRSLSMSNQGTTKFYTKDSVKRDWILIDAKDQTLGRLATKVAMALRGKDKPNFTPNQDCGSFVVITNSSLIKVTGKKMSQKLYRRHSGTPGGYKEETLANLLKRRPNEVIRKAVKGMLPHNRLSDRLITKLKIYEGESHPHTAQVK